MKYYIEFLLLLLWLCRSREGAWIEIWILKKKRLYMVVAPARERGLKYVVVSMSLNLLRRSREGAWIEMPIGNIF